MAHDDLDEFRSLHLTQGKAAAIREEICKLKEKQSQVHVGSKLWEEIDIDIADWKYTLWVAEMCDLGGLKGEIAQEMWEREQREHS